MKKRFVVLALLAAGTLTLSACAPAVQAPGPDGYRLRPAVNAERRALTVPGFGQVTYYASAAGTGRPLVLTHSVNAAASGYEMKPLWESYAGQRPVYLLEWPGFGSSDRPDITYTPELMASALAALVAQLNTEVDVVSLSLGSEFAARAALAEPRIRSLALISPSGFGQPRNGTQDAAADDGGLKLYNTLNSFGDVLYGTLRTRPSLWYFLSRSFRGEVPGDVIDYAADTSAQPGAKYAPLYFVSGRLFNPDAYTNLYAKLTVPTLVLYDQDAFVSFDRLPQFDALPNTTVVRIPGTDGLPQWEKLPEVRAALDAFWSAQP